MGVLRENRLATATRPGENHRHTFAKPWSTSKIPTVDGPGLGEGLAVSVALVSEASIAECPSGRLRAMNGFSPLPSIVGSPPCTPTAPNPPAPVTEAATSGLQDTGYPPILTVSLGVLPSPIGTPTQDSPSHKSGLPSTSMDKAPAPLFVPPASFPASMHRHADDTQGQLPKINLESPSQRHRRRRMSEPHPPRPSKPPTADSPSLRLALQNMLPAAEKDAQAVPKRTKPIFDLSGSSSDGEEEAQELNGSQNHSSSNEAKLEGKWDDRSKEETQRIGKQLQDSTRRYHALRELLLSERTYVTDLKAFVTVPSFMSISALNGLLNPSRCISETFQHLLSVHLSLGELPRLHRVLGLSHTTKSRSQVTISWTMATRPSLPPLPSKTHRGPILDTSSLTMSWKRYHATLKTFTFFTNASSRS
jgi:hypothetical protein